MITIQDFGGNTKLYELILKQLKRKVSIFKRYSIKGISKNDAATCEELSIKGINVENLDFLRFFPKLKSLYLGNTTGLKNIDGICNCKLHTLYIFNVNLDDFSVFAKCSSLKTFSYLYDDASKSTPCKDVSFVKYLPELENLYLPWQEADITPILQCYSLKELELSNSQIDSVEQFNVLPNLNNLILWGCGLKETVDFSGFANLKRIELPYNNFTGEQIDEMIRKYPEISFQFKTKN